MDLCIDQVPFLLYYLDVTMLLSYHPTAQAPFLSLQLDSTYFVRHLDHRGPRYYYCAVPPGVSIFPFYCVLLSLSPL